MFLAGCGGGGSSGGAGAGGTPAPGPGTTGGDAPAVQVSLGAVRLADKLYEGTRRVLVESLQIAVTGDTAALSGRTLHAKVEIADPLFETAPVISFGTGGIIVGLPGRSDVPAGHYTGTVKVSACLDAACATPLAGSPMSAPYDVEVLPAFKLSQETVTFRGPFGAQLPPVEVSFVNMPAGSTADFSDLWLGSRDLTFNRTADDKIVITPLQGTAPGTYTRTTTVRSIAPDPTIQFSNVIINKTLTAQYTVEPVDSPYFLSPASASYTFSLGEASRSRLTQKQDRFNFGLQSPTTSLQAFAVRFDAAPPEAAGHPEVNDWLIRTNSAFNQYVVAPCGWSETQTNCLPVGTYRAALPFEIRTSEGVVTRAEFPVTMIITP